MSHSLKSTFFRFFIFNCHSNRFNLIGFLCLFCFAHALCSTLYSLISMVSFSISISNRDARNLAEKNRRDKFNGLINELHNLVPMAQLSSRRLDKTSILRLSASFLRLLSRKSLSLFLFCSTSFFFFFQITFHCFSFFSFT